MAYTRQLVTELKAVDFNRLYKEEEVKEDLLSEFMRCEPKQVKSRLKEVYQDAIDDDDKYLIGFYEDELLIRVIACYKVYEYDGQQRTLTGIMLTGKNSQNTKSWQFDKNVAESFVPGSEDFQKEMGSIGIIIEAHSKGMYDSLKNGGGQIELIEISPWDEIKQKAKFISNFGFD